MQSKPLVSIITVNYNGAQVTCELIASLRKISYSNIEIIVVDNGSNESPDRIAEEYPEVILIKSPQNLGFSGGNNLGFRQAKGDYFLMLNNDTEVESDFLEPLVSILQSKKEIGVVSPKIMFFHSPGIIQFAGFTPINPYTGRGYAIGSHQQDGPAYNTSMPTHRAHGAAMMLKREVVEQVGLMADIFFLYYEEMDYCERIKNAGWQIWYVANSVVHHKESISVGKNSSLKMYYLTRNRLLYMRRNVPFFKRMVSTCFFTFLTIPKTTIQLVRKKDFTLLKAFYKGIAWNLTHYRIGENPTL